MKPAAIALLCASLFVAPVWAHDAPNEPERLVVTGEVEQVNTKKKTITLKHEPLKNLGKPAGTTEFPVRSDKMLQQVKVGDKVLFSARNVEGTVSIRTLAPAPARAAEKKEPQTEGQHAHAVEGKAQHKHAEGDGHKH